MSSRAQDKTRKRRASTRSSVIRSSSRTNRNWSPSLLDNTANHMGGATGLLVHNQSLLTDTSDILSDIPSILTDTSGILSDMPSILTDTSSILNEMPSILTDTSSILNDRPSILTDTSSILNDTPGILTDTSGILADTSSILEDTSSFLADTSNFLTSSILADQSLQHANTNDDESCIIIESDDDDTQETSTSEPSCLADDSIICLGVYENMPRFTPCDEIEVISEHVTVMQNSPPLYIVSQSTNLEPTSDGVETVSTSHRNPSYPTNTRFSPGVNINRSEEQENHAKCPVCLEDVKTMNRSNKRIMVTVCGHIYCHGCLENIMKMDRQCATCRKKINKKQYHPVYL